MIWTLVLGFVLVITAGYILALLFHWIKYGATLPWVWVALPIYLGGTAFLILIMLSAYRALV